MKSNPLYRRPLQNRFRPFAFVALATCSWMEVTLAQDAVPAAAADISDSAPATTVKSTRTAADPISNATTNPAPRTSNPFRTGESTRANSARRSAFAYDNGGADELSGTPSRRKAVDVELDPKSVVPSSGGGNESRIVAPSFYGRGPQVITPGQGQFARPKYRYGISAGIGYDDNPDQTPTRTPSVLALRRSRSGFTNVNGHFDAQWLKPRTVFTVNLEASGDFYWDRPGNSADENVRLGMLYVNKIDPLTQFTANASFAYLSQPDYSNFYASTNQAAGDYFTGSTKFDLSHRWTPVFSTVTSASVNLLKFVDQRTGGLSNSYWTYIFGNEFRFQASPRLTYIAEGRYELDDYITNSTLDSQTAYALGGIDWLASKHLTATFRAGASFREFDFGGQRTAPYAEFSINYLTGRHSTLTINGRYGFEQSSSAGDDNQSYRFGFLYQRAFTSRFSGNTGVNFVHTNFNTRGAASNSTDVVDLNVGVQYRVDRHFSLGARYSYTVQDSQSGFQDFDRNRVLFSVQYEY